MESEENREQHHHLHDDDHNPHHYLEIIWESEENREQEAGQEKGDAGPEPPDTKDQEKMNEISRSKLSILKSNSFLFI